MFFKSIRFKIMLMYMFLLMLTLSVFSVILYGSFSEMLYSDLDDLLSSRAEGIADSINTYSSVHPEMPHQDRPADFLKCASQWVEEKRRDPELMSIFVGILDSNGKLLAGTKNMPQLAPLPEESRDDIEKGIDSFDTVKGKTTGSKSINFRVYTKPVIQNNKNCARASASTRKLSTAPSRLFAGLDNDGEKAR